MSRLIEGDCLEVLERLDTNSVDCVIGDPPYNLSPDAGDWEWEAKNWGITDEEWDSDTWDAYAQFTAAWIGECARVLRPTGTIWTFGSYHNTPYINLGYREHGEILNEIIWFKRNAFPNMSGRRFTASHETILWGHLNGDEREYTFNYEAVKAMECPEDHFTEADKQIRTVWDIPTNKSEPERVVDHETQKPLRVYERLIHAATHEGDTILFPFLGSGAGAVSANLNNREYIGIERDPEYIEMAETFLETVTEKPEMVDAVLDAD